MVRPEELLILDLSIFANRRFRVSSDLGVKRASFDMWIFVTWGDEQRIGGFNGDTNGEELGGPGVKSFF